MALGKAIAAFAVGQGRFSVQGRSDCTGKGSESKKFFRSTGQSPTGQKIWRIDDGDSKLAPDRRRRKTKIAATLDQPVEQKADTGLFLAGADVFRINMSHTDHANLPNWWQACAVEAEQGRPI